MTGPPMVLQGAVRYPVREIILPCSATLPEWMGNAPPFSAKLAEIRRWHMQDRSWRNSAYHSLIGFDGQRAAGRPETDIGAHVECHNSGTIGIFLIGGHGAAADDAFGDHFTAPQARTLRALIADIRSRTQIERVTGHNTYAAKACPGIWVARRVQARPKTRPSQTQPKPAARCRRDWRACALRGRLRC